MSYNYKPGDIIGINRLLYVHYVLYVGDNRVFHYISDTYFGKRAKIEFCDFDIILSNSTHFLANKNFEDLKKNDIQHILSNIYTKIGENNDYCLFTNNCEHFITELCFNYKISRQVNKYKYSILTLLSSYIVYKLIL